MNVTTHGIDGIKRCKKFFITWTFAPAELTLGSFKEMVLIKGCKSSGEADEQRVYQFILVSKIISEYHY